MRMTHQMNILHAAVTTMPIGFVMMELEPRSPVVLVCQMEDSVRTE